MTGRRTRGGVALAIAAFVCACLAGTAAAHVDAQGAKGTTRRTYRFGQPEVCARALLTRPSTEAAESAMTRRRLIMAFLPFDQTFDEATGRSPNAAQGFTR